MIAFALAAALLLSACSSHSAPILQLDPSELREGLPRETIRVGLAVGKDQLTLGVPSRYELVDRRGKLLRKVDRGGDISVDIRDGAIRVRAGGRTLENSARTWIRIRPRSKDALFRYGANEYAGEMLLRIASGRTLTLVNVLGVEDYLRGVVPWEIGRPDEDALEAVKAQAIAARTYTYAHLGHWEQLGFDVYDSVADQVYRGRTGLHPLTDRAVRDTRNLVISHNGRLVRAYYSSTCGGYGSTLEDVWSREAAPYLVGRRDAAKNGSWCKASAQFRWSESWSARQLGDIIRAHLPKELGRSLAPEDIGIIQEIRVLKRDRSGRVQDLRIITDRDSFDVWGDRIRWVLRPFDSRFGILRSTFFELAPVYRDGVLVAMNMQGGGFGHGVGMCQTGALGMARAGFDAEEILEHYYRGVRIGSSFDARVLP